MKKNLYFLNIALSLVLVAPALVCAQDNQNSSANPGTQLPPLPPVNAAVSNYQQLPPTGNSDDQPATQPASGTIRARLQSDYQTGLQNLQNNRDYRNVVMEGRYGSSSTAYASGTPPFRGGPNAIDLNGQGDNPGMMPLSARFASTSLPRYNGREDGSPTAIFRLRPLPSGLMPPLMKRFASSTMFASSTLVQQIMANHQSEQSLRADAFAFLQDNLVQQSNQSLTNLQQIRARIASLIQTETTKGLDMSKATALLATADSDISTAEQAVQALATYVPSTGSAALTASTTVDLGQARKLGSAAIQSVNTARQALDQVVSAIIQAMGISPTGSSTETTRSSNQ